MAKTVLLGPPLLHQSFLFVPVFSSMTFNTSCFSLPSIALPPTLFLSRCSWDDSSSVSSGLSDTLDNISTDDLNTPTYSSVSSSRKSKGAQVRPRAQTAQSLSLSPEMMSCGVNDGGFVIISQVAGLYFDTWHVCVAWNQSVFVFELLNHSLMSEGQRSDLLRGSAMFCQVSLALYEIVNRLGS